MKHEHCAKRKPATEGALLRCSHAGSLTPHRKSHDQQVKSDFFIQRKLLYVVSYTCYTVFISHRTENDLIEMCSTTTPAISMTGGSRYANQLGLPMYAMYDRYRRSEFIHA
eukprot:scaffold58293_cov25-Prasinocladus_malaysianus.AAC.1